MTDHGGIALFRPIQWLPISFQIIAKFFTMVGSSPMVCPLTILSMSFLTVSQRDLLALPGAHQAHFCLRVFDLWEAYNSNVLFSKYLDFTLLTPFISLMMLFMAVILKITIITV